MGIAALLSVASFGETAARVLVTTVVVGCASVVTLACLVPLDSRWAAVSVAGLVVTVATASYALVMVWVNTESWDDDAWRALGVGITVSLTIAQMCLLLGVSVRRPSVSLLVWATLAVATLLAGLVIALIVGWDAGDADGRLIGIVAILDVLGTLVAIALGIFGSDERTLSVTLSPATGRGGPVAGGRDRPHARRRGARRGPFLRRVRGGRRRLRALVLTVETKVPTVGRVARRTPTLDP